MTEGLTLTHLRMLEAESIHILREVVAEFQRPVMLYSIGKDSSVMVRLAQKAFSPGRIPFPLLHVDTTYKFREMIEFRDRFCAEIGRDPAEITRSVTQPVSYENPGGTRDSIAAAVAAGFQHVVLSLPAPYPGNVARWVADEIISKSG